jgi:inosine-uridine nucleoside N-ribohydrolase
MNLKYLLAYFIAAILTSTSAQQAAPPPKAPPAKIIFDTDIGNDVDDVLALCILHSLQTRGACELLAVTITKPDDLAGPFVDAVNTFYGRPGIPIGYTQAGLTNEPSKFLSLANAKDNGNFRYPHTLIRSADAPAATLLLRKILAGQPDGSVVLVQVGFFSNFAALLASPPDDFSPLPGPELVKQKVRFLSIMAGAFQTIGNNNHYLEYNVICDIPAAQKLARDWPSPIVWSGFEIGIAAPYPASSIERDFHYVHHHPAAEAYYLYNPPPHNRPTWDPTSALYAVASERGYFNLSAPGSVTVETDGFTRFIPNPGGRDRFLILNPDQIPRLKEALVQLASQPPTRQGK